MTMTVPHPLSMPARVTDVCEEVIPPEGYRTPLWHEARRGCISASEIATVLGVGRFQSPFDLWWAKRLGDGGVPDNDAMSRGRRLEPLVLEDFTAQYPDLTLRHVGLVRNTERPWQVATPDALAYEGFPHGRLPGEGYMVRGEFMASLDPVAVVEAKTDGGSDHWGDAGTDDIPLDYKAQVLWQMDTVGVDHGYVPVWLGFAYRCYEVQLDRDDVEFMRQAARDFLDSLDADVPPPLDSHKTTTARLKSLHANVVDEAVAVPEAVVRQYLAAQRLRDAATARLRLHENRLRALIGDAQRGVLPDGRVVAKRSVYDVKARTQTVGAHTVDRLNVKPAKDSRPEKGLVLRAVRCTGVTSRGTRCKREHVTTAEAWTCRTHREAS